MFFFCCSDFVTINKLQVLSSIWNLITMGKTDFFSYRSKLLAQVNNSFPLLIQREPPAAGHPSHPGGLPPGWRAAGGLGGLHPTALQHPANDSSRSHRQF